MNEDAKETVAALKRAHAHMKAAGADPAKIAEIEEHLRLAGHPVDDDKGPEDGVKATPSAPKNRRAPERSRADAPSGKAAKSDPAPARPAAAPSGPDKGDKDGKGSNDVTGSGGIVLPKPSGSNS